MKPTWKKYLLYGTMVIAGSVLVFVLEETIRLKNTGFETKTLWDWMELLVIPSVLAIGAFLLNQSERAVERQTAENRAKFEREIATDRQQEAALQAYLDRMADLLLQKELRASENEEVRNVARIRTLTVLHVLDATRKGTVVCFLCEAGLISQEQIVDLSGADLTRAYLVGADLSGANLSGTSLYGASLSAANLSGANLSGANLNTAQLVGANLSAANLSGTSFNGASLFLANLDRADLSRASLIDATVFNDQLETVKSLRGAITPDRTKHD